jgi:hypothetical protein
MHSRKLREDGSTVNGRNPLSTARQIEEPAALKRRRLLIDRSHASHSQGPWGRAGAG